MSLLPEVHSIGDALDAALASQIQQVLSDNRRGYERVSIGVQDRAVRLSGAVRSFYLRQMALALTKAVEGVCHVVDDLEVDLDEAERRGEQERRLGVRLRCR